MCVFDFFDNLRVNHVFLRVDRISLLRIFTGSNHRMKVESKSYYS